MIRASSLWLAAYLLGSIPFGVLLARLRKVDLRRTGSGNIGATNVARTLGKTAGALTLLGDAAKGALAVGLADHYLTPPWAVAGAGLFAFLGHVFSIFLGFRGGKGVATGLGVFLYLMPWAALSAVGVFAVTLWRFHYVSVSSLCAAFSVVIFAIAYQTPLPYQVLAGVVGLIVAARHHENIRRLFKGAETKFIRK